MSKPAALFITLTLMLISIDLLLPANAEALSYAARIAGAVSFCVFVVALMVGRRFKFDPVLR
ncbi:PA3371 family protein [Pseudomonas sp. G.S.17]|uniref:PA3371 family protein n=1 Tax=Pseudomonas sp. G.S.17 TaxID=3137451 RepID=UPI00311C9B0D